MDPAPGDLAADAPAGREMDVSHWVRRAGGTDRARLGPATRDIFSRTDFRAARHDGHRVQRAGGEDRPPCNQLLDAARDRGARGLRPSRGRMEQCTRLPVRRRGAGLDYRRLPGLWSDAAEPRQTRQRTHPVAAFGRNDDHGPADAGAEGTSGFAPRFFDSHGWGFGVSIVTRREELAGSIGTFGWAGGLGTSWCTDPP